MYEHATKFCRVIFKASLINCFARGNTCPESITSNNFEKELEFGRESDQQKPQWMSVGCSINLDLLNKRIRRSNTMIFLETTDKRPLTHHEATFCLEIVGTAGKKTIRAARFLEGQSAQAYVQASL